MKTLEQAWEKYANGTQIDHFAWWCERYLLQWVDQWEGKPLILERWQREFMGEALAVDEDGQYVWSSVALVVSRKNGKTMLLAAYALYRLLNDEGNPEILLTASSDKQAGRLFNACVHFIRSNPELERRVHLREYIGEITRRDGKGTILRMASDPSTLHGYEPSLVICDELHAWTKPMQQKSWSALVSGGGSRKQTQVFTITVAGAAHERHESILGKLIDRNEEHGDVEKRPGLTISRNHEAETLIYNHNAPTTDPHDTKAMKLANPASWIGESYLRRQAMNPELDASDCLQLHGCVWAASEKTWLPEVAIEACERPFELDTIISEQQPVVLAFDGSSSRDSTVLVGCTLTGYGFVIEAWERPLHAPENWRVPVTEVNVAVDEAMETFNVVEFAPDPPHWRAEIEAWEETHGELVVRFETNKRTLMAPACDRMRSAVLAVADDEADESVPRFYHDGSEVLVRHFAHCQRKRTPQGTVVQKDSPDSPRKIDAAVAMIVAYDRAMWHAAHREEEQEPGWAFV